MGCGISTCNLPSYMRRYPANRKNRQLSWRVNEGDDDQKILIIDHQNNVDSLGAVDLHENDNRGYRGKTSNVSPAPVKKGSALEKGCENKNNIKNNGDINNIVKERKNDDPGHGGKAFNVSPAHAKKDSELDKGCENENDIKNDGDINIVKERKNHEEENDVEEEYEREDNINNLSWIGSPSFRDYCGNQHDSSDFDEKIDGEQMETEIQGADTKLPNEGSIERRQRRSRFRKVFPVTKSSSDMKNMLSVTTCYNSTSRSNRS